MQALIVIYSEDGGGRPIVAGTRTHVSDVLDALTSVSIDELLPDFSDITRVDVNVCLAYGADDLSIVHVSGPRHSV